MIMILRKFWSFLLLIEVLLIMVGIVVTLFGFIADNRVAIIVGLCQVGSSVMLLLTHLCVCPINCKNSSAESALHNVSQVIFVTSNVQGYEESIRSFQNPEVYQNYAFTDIHLSSGNHQYENQFPQTNGLQVTNSAVIFQGRVFYLNKITNLKIRSLSFLTN